MIGQRELSLLARAGHVSERAQEQDYVLSWLLAARGVRGPANLVFKGGTALRRCYFENYRYSQDLDFTLLRPAPPNELSATLSSWFSWVRDGTGIVCGFARDPATEGQGFVAYISYTGPLRGGGTVKFDANSDETIRTPVETCRILSPYSDLTQPPEVAVYSLVEIWAEKVRSLVQRSEPRDLYDISELAGHDRALPGQGLPVFLQKMEDKGLGRHRLVERLNSAETTFARLWEMRLVDQVSPLPEFQETWRRVRRVLRAGGYLAY